MRQKLIAGNWKMHGSKTFASALMQAIDAASFPLELAVFPPFVYLPQCQSFQFSFGAQNCAAFSDGAFTGEVSAAMLKDMGCRYVIIGHSERRQLFHESNEITLDKCIQAVTAGLLPILCVGETLAQREANQTLTVVKEQLAVVGRLKDNCSQFSEIVIAYEPVWAIGTGRSASPEDAETVHTFIRDQLSQLDADLAKKTRILYGGSVKPDNARALFKMPNVDGALVGGAALVAEDFLAIARAAVNEIK